MERPPTIVWIIFLLSPDNQMITSPNLILRCIQFENNIKQELSEQSPLLFSEEVALTDG